MQSQWVLDHGIYMNIQCYHKQTVKLFLNSQEFPHGNMNINIANNQYALLYEMFALFQSSFYEKKNTKPIINKTNFINETPLVVIDWSKQNETTKRNETTKLRRTH